jgi:hypothetical protein
MAGSGSGRTLLLPWVDRHKTRETHPFFRHPGGLTLASSNMSARRGYTLEETAAKISSRWLALRKP